MNRSLQALPGRRSGELSPGERWLHRASTAAVGGSGLVYLWMKYGMDPPEDPFRAVNHPWQPHVLHLHVLASPVLLLLIGAILRDHVVGRLRNPHRRRGRLSGSGVALLLIPLVASGYLLQVTTAESARRLLAGVHLVTGCGWLLAFVAHLIAGRLAAERLPQPGDRDEGTPLEPEGLHLRLGRAPRRRAGPAVRTSSR
jgi:hypothetical protein